MSDSPASESDSLSSALNDSSSEEFSSSIAFPFFSYQLDMVIDI